MGVWVRRVDARLASGAVRNAATHPASLEQRLLLEDARTMRDLRTLRPAHSFTPMARHSRSYRAVH
jgi:hypothetical protein